MHEHFLDIWDEFFIGMKRGFYNFHHSCILALENVVCSHLELKRHEISFSLRRDTMCRQLSIYIPTTTLSDRWITSPSFSSNQQSNRQTSISMKPDSPAQYRNTSILNNASRHNTISSMNSINPATLTNIGEQQLHTSSFFWIGSTKSAKIKNVFLLLCFFPINYIPFCFIFLV